MGVGLRKFTFKLVSFSLAFMVALCGPELPADPVHVHYTEGVTLGFLILRSLNGQILAYGELNQVANPADGVVTDDLHFRFNDGSFFQEITKFTQRGEFHLISDHVLQKGPTFGQGSETWIDTSTGSVKVRTVEDGKTKEVTKHMDLPADVSNGLLFTIVKNLDPGASETSISMVAATNAPRLVTLSVSPAQSKTIRVGRIKYQAQHYVVKVKIGGIAGAVAPLIGKQPPEIHVWIVKSGVPMFLESEGPLSPGTPVWRIQLTAPQRSPTAANQGRTAGGR